MFEKKSPLEKEWDTFLKKEERILKKYGKAKQSIIDKKLEAIVPKGFQSKLETAFYKSFQTILESGTGVIEKTYSKEKLETDFKVREYRNQLKPTRKNLKCGTKAAGLQTVKNVAGAGIEGAALGLLGIGLPDILLFQGVIFRSLYTLCLNYGIDYNDSREQELLLELIALSLYKGSDFKGKDALLNRKLFEMISQKNVVSDKRKISGEAIKKAAQALSGELLYLKFLQGVPIAGVIGGIYDGIYLKRITDYAAVKMERRYLLSKLKK